jgi:DNA-binding response OmpR family regulator
MRMARVLIIDDDVELCRLLAERLSTEDIWIEAIHNGLRGLEHALSQNYALVILDLMLPGMKGLDVLRHLRERSTVPVLILTARGEDVDRILGFEIGADDYLPKPFNPRELIARIHAILRRTNHAQSAAAPLVLGDIRLDSAAREAWINNTQLYLPV